MRYPFKTSYEQDISIVKGPRQALWYVVLLLMLLGAPWLFGAYVLSQLTFVLIYSIVCIGMMLLAGFTGLFSLGHAAFVGVGAYTQALLANLGTPFPIALAAAGALSGVLGLAVGLPVLRLKGIYLGIATLAFGFIIEEGVVRWESLTMGSAGLSVKKPQMFGWTLSSDWELYYLCLFVCVVATLGVLNLLRSSTGRAFIAIRDSEVSAQSMGIQLARYKATSFALSAALAGLGGALYAHKLTFISPDQFSAMLSVDLLMMVVIGGLGSLHGAFFGAAFLIVMPQLIAGLKDYLPTFAAQAAGLQGLVYGVILVAFVLFEPAGLYGRWVKVRTYLEMFPYYPAGMFRRQKSFQRAGAR